MVLTTMMTSIMILKFFEGELENNQLSDSLQSYFELGKYIGLTIIQLKDSQSDFSLI